MPLPMSKNTPRLTATIIVVNLIVINLVLYLFANLDYPLIGHDYHLIIPQMLDSLLYYRNNGISIQWYTPSFGGGIPAFPDPSNNQFSIMNFLLFWMTPWNAILISTFGFISIGFVAFYKFLKKLLNLSVQSSLLGAIFFSANGFIFERMAVGHVGCQPFPLLALIALLIYDISIPSYIAGILLGLIFAIAVYQLGYFLIVIFALSMLMVIPITRLIRPENFPQNHIFYTTIFGTLVGLFVSAAKLSAIYSFMRFFPRMISDTYNVSLGSGIFGIVLQLLGTMNLAPLLIIARIDPNLLPKYLVYITGAKYGFWEFDMSIAPTAIGIILIGITKFFHSLKNNFSFLFSEKNWIFTLSLLFFVVLTIQFTLASGEIYSTLQNLPVLKSLHVNIRYAAAFILPLALTTAVIYNSLSQCWGKKKSWVIYSLINALTIISMGSFFIFSDDIQNRIYDVSSSLEIYQSIRSGKKFEVSLVGYTENNTQALKEGISNLNLYSPILGYGLENFHPELSPGSIWDSTGGFFNMTNPSSLIFPDINHTQPFERIKVNDFDNLMAFVNYRQTEWKLPAYQLISNWLSIGALISSTLILSYYLFRIFLKRIIKPK